MINNRQNGRRRGRGSGPRPAGNVPNQPNRQDNRSRGNAAQLHEKYKALARDAQLAGDRVQTEYFLQFADHYYRILNESRARFEEQRRQRDDYDEDEDQDGDMNASDGYDDREAADERPEPRRQQSEAREDRGGRERENRNGRDRGDRNEREQRSPREPVAESEPRPPREQASERQAPDREAEGDREPRAERRPRRERLARPRSQEPQDDEGQARISLDVLPPAIAADVVEVAPKPRRRTRRPDPDTDVDIAPAA